MIFRRPTACRVAGSRIDALVIRRHPVTNAEYLEFLDDSTASGREAEALAAIPRADMGSVDATEERPMFSRDGSGRFVLPHGGADPAWQLRGPVVLVDWHQASAYARWLAARSEQGFRLPNELEREKAARGVDGRLLAWGDHLEATFACVLDAHSGPPRRENVDDRPTDESPYGVRGTTGNVRDWCINVWKHAGPQMDGDRLCVDAAAPEDPDFRSIKGGFWGAPATMCRSAGRFGSRPGICRLSVGVRVVRSYGRRVTP
ncbi:MAG: SUMF1/EgtB/PvdO family nonheme iron enzyme [Minicystis sp.]